MIKNEDKSEMKTKFETISSPDKSNSSLLSKRQFLKSADESMANVRPVNKLAMILFFKFTQKIIKKYSNIFKQM